MEARAHYKICPLKTFFISREYMSRHPEGPVVTGAECGEDSAKYFIITARMQPEGSARSRDRGSLREK